MPTAERAAKERLRDALVETTAEVREHIRRANLGWMGEPIPCPGCGVNMTPVPHLVLGRSWCSWWFCLLCQPSETLRELDRWRARVERALEEARPTSR